MQLHSSSESYRRLLHLLYLPLPIHCKYHLVFLKLLHYKVQIRLDHTTGMPAPPLCVLVTVPLYSVTPESILMDPADAEKEIAAFCTAVPFSSVTTAVTIGLASLVANANKYCFDDGSVRSRIKLSGEKVVVPTSTRTRSLSR